MPTFRFKRIATTEYEIEVRADSYEQARARVSVGSMDWVERKEGVEVTDCNERTEVVDVPDRADVDDVVFLRDPDGGDVFAAFPGYAATVNNPDNLTCYEHVGQHGAADIGYCDGCVEVTDPAEYQDLYAELVQRGYELYVVSKDRLYRADYRAQRLEQLRAE